MAASESKPDESRATAKIEDLHRCTEMPDNRPAECNTYSGLHIFFYLLSIAIFVASLITVVSVMIEHWINGYKPWAFYTLFLAVVPSSVLQMLSLKWYQTNGELKFHQWISHIFQFAIIHRFGFLLHSAFESMKARINVENKEWHLRLENDAFTLNLFTTLIVSVPQIILQVYIMAILQHLSFWTGASVITSLCSITWALSSYALLTNKANQDKSQFTWSSMMIQAFWRGGMLAARIAALVLAAICFKTWILVTFGIHTLGMTVWIIQQPANFCISTLDELAYKCLIGVVYFFDFFRLTDNRVRYNVCVFYSVMILQNATFYTVYLVSFKHLFPANVLIVSTVLIIGGIFVGLSSMLMHLCMFQNVKTIKLCKRVHVDPELSLKVSPSKSISSRSPKKLNNHNAANDSAENMPDTTADKKCLLTNIVQNTESMEKGILNTSFIKNDETNVTVQVVVEDNKVTNVDVSIEKLQNQSTLDKDSCSIDISIEKVDSMVNSSTDSLHRQKRRGICSEAELDPKSDEMCNLDLETQLCSQKRRGICSLTQLGLELITDEDNYVEKSFSSLDKLKSNSELSVDAPDKSIDSGILDSLPIKSLITDSSCDLVIPESILVRGRLSTPAISESGETTVTAQLSDKAEESQKQLEEETMSHVTSIHDYENLCPLGVARPPWFIRSWQGYTDIETYIHDDSVVRDRRRDTLTSTATGTTFSSDFSDATYASLRKMVKRSRQDDYLDTLIYDLVDWESLSNKMPVEEASTTTSESTEDAQTQDQTNLFCAKPIVIDEKGGMLALDTILEEREDHSSFPELRMALNNSSNTCSVSSLVATIDEIRKCTAENSPRHVYHRTESQWEDLEQKQALLMKQARLTKVLFANDYSNVTLSYPDTWAASRVSDRNNDKLNFIREMTKYCLKDSSGKTPLINAILSDSPILSPKADTQNCESHQVIEEDNVYVDMNALGAQKCSSESHKNQDNCQETKKDALTQTNLDIKNNMDNEVKEKKVAFALTNEIINDALETCSEKSDSSSNKNSDTAKVAPFSIDKRRRAINRPRRKFSILRERFEPKFNDQLVSMVAPPLHNKLNSSRQQLHSLNKRISVIFNDPDAFDSSLNYDKQNLTMKSSSSVVESKNKLSDTFKEKRSIFLKQVLPPQRFQGWGKKRTFSPNAKIISEAH